jgi:sirohydrochlorin ferrochelatase
MEFVTVELDDQALVGEVGVDGVAADVDVGQRDWEVVVPAELDQGVLEQ